jgi:hypothetical protein
MRSLARTATAALVAAGALVSQGRPRVAWAAPSVWVIDDGEKIRRDATSTPFERGDGNPVWRPGEPVRLFGLRDEVVALQVVVEADATALSAVTVDVALSSAGGAPMTQISRFVEHFVRVRRASGGATPRESLAWEPGAGPPERAWVGAVPDALIPVELAPAWAHYPLRVEPHTNGIVWVDIGIPVDQPAGICPGTIVVAAGGSVLASIPVELAIGDATLPGPAARATAFYDPDELERRVGPDAEVSLWQLLHAHRISPMHDARSPEDVTRQRDALSGALYRPDRGYAGPGAGAGDGVLAIGAYGGLGSPDPSKLARVEAIVDAAAAAGVLEQTDTFVYADDERCASPRGEAWRDLLRGSADPRVRRVRVAWTCSDDPSRQPVDIPILFAHYARTSVERARSQRKDVWVYNGVLPRTGTFLLDDDAISPRVNGWLAAIFGVPRWFYWESTYWYGAHGQAPIDPFVEPETLHNRDGDWANGDGVLVYPGTQRDAFGEHSLGWAGVLPSIRLKNWRRGLEDAAYLELARARDGAGANAVARNLVPAAFDDARRGRPPSWSSRGMAFFQARRALLALALGEGTPTYPPKAPRHAHDFGGDCLAATAFLALGYVLLRRRLSVSARFAAGSRECRGSRATPGAPSRNARPYRRPTALLPSRRGAAESRSSRPPLAGLPGGEGRRRKRR